MYFPAWNRLHAVHYCTDPAGNGHAVRSLLLPRPPAGDPGTGSGGPAGPAEDAPPDPDRRLVIEGNKAWKAAAEVRKRWLATVLFARRNAPRPAGPFVARQLLVMPDPLRSGLAGAPGRELFREITGQRADRLVEVCETTAAGRLPLLMLGPIVTAYEQAMTKGEGKNTWRTDRYAPCPRREAGRYLSFLASIGYPLSAVEQALADDIPYLGDAHVGSDSTDPATDGTGTDSQPGDDGPADDGDGQAETSSAPTGGDGPDDGSPEAA